MTRNELLASLIETADRDAVCFDDDRYIDWSCQADSDDGRQFTIGDGENDASFDLSWSEIERLHKALTVLLLER